MNFENILDEKKNHSFSKNPLTVALGYDDNHEILEIDLKSYPSIVITGSTGTSKSIMIHEILLQLMKKNSPESLKLIPIAPTGVELQEFASSPYSNNPVIKDKNNSTLSLQLFLNEIEERKILFKNHNVKDFKHYNEKYSEDPLPFLILVIDEATDILTTEKCELILKQIIEQCPNTGTSIIISTNNVYNDFFEKDINTLANCKISFDFVSSKEAKLTNLKGCQDLELNQFLVRLNSERKIKKYQIFDFNEKYES